MKKKFIALLLSMTMLIGGTMTVYAADPDVQEKTVQVTTASTSQTDASYVIELPATIELKKKGTTGEDQFIYTSDYTAGIKGILPAGKTVEFKPKTNTFEMTGTNTSTKATATVEQAITVWIKNGETPGNGQMCISPTDYAETTGTISVPITVADAYTGEIGFSIECKTA